jgi:hypothetical protein
MLLGNCTRDSRNPLRQLGGTPGNERNDYGRPGSIRNFAMGEAAVSGVSAKAGLPSGYRGSYTWMLPNKAGALKSFLESEGVATATLALAAGRNIVATSEGTATAEAIGQLVVSGVGTADGVATVTGNIVAALGGAGTADGTSTATGAINALAWANATVTSTATVEATIFATGQLVGSIAPAVDLEAASFSAYLLDTELVETGLTVRETLRIALSALGGKVAISGNTVTFRDANDTKDRITATTDTNGQRTAVTLDPD